MTDKAPGNSGRPSWAGPSTTSAFTPPSAARPLAPARPSPSEPRPPKGPRKTKTRRAPKKSDRLVTLILAAVVVVSLVAAGVLIWKAFTPETVAAPLPASEFKKPATGTPVGPTGKEPVKVTAGNEADGGDATMTVAEMGPSTLFIPALGVYMPIEADSQFESSHYTGFDTLKIPSDPSHGVWYAGGAPMYGGQKGVTLIAGHVSSATAWGALRYLYTLTGGEMIYTKDAAGQLQSWQMTEMRVEDHTRFPAEYWSAEGDRYLVVTTCGGNVAANNLFTQNIFAVAVPVDPKPKTPEELRAESVIASLGALAVQRNAEALAAEKTEKTTEGDQP